MAKSNGKSPAQGSVGNSSEHKIAILAALSSVQECHVQGSTLWLIIDKAKKEIEAETDEGILKAKRSILYEEFKKEMDAAFPEK